MALTMTVIADRIEAGTYAMAAGMTGGDVLLRGARADTLEAMIDVLTRAGVTVQRTMRACASTQRQRA